MAKSIERKFGLIGYPLTHSFSPGYFKTKFELEHIIDCRYDLYPLESIDEVSALFKSGLSGINVTIPYKEEVMHYLTHLSDEAREIGAVNTILIEGARKTGFNTDVYGFEKSLVSFCGDALPFKALILGSGGASKGVSFVLRKLGIEHQVVSRSKGNVSYDDLSPDMVAEHKLIVNTTPLGMSPDLDKFPDIPYLAIGKEHCLYDLIYNPEKTLFLAAGERRGAKIKNGFEMLRLQADRSWQIWNEPQYKS